MFFIINKLVTIYHSKRAIHGLKLLLRNKSINDTMTQNNTENVIISVEDITTYVTHIQSNNRRYEMLVFSLKMF